ncbi:MAG: hypothetical protein QM831_29560 [Kofleriaceae bacterium]
MRSILAVVATIPVWLVLARTTTYEPGTYAPLTGFAASHGFWLALVAACVGALALRRRGRWPVAGVLAGVIAVRVAIAGFTPADPVVTETDCSNLNIPTGCQIGKALDRAFDTTPSVAGLRWWLNLATGVSTGVLVAIFVWPRDRMPYARTG